MGIGTVPVAGDRVPDANVTHTANPTTAAPTNKYELTIFSWLSLASKKTFPTFYANNVNVDLQRITHKRSTADANRGAKKAS